MRYSERSLSKFTKHVIIYFIEILFFTSLIRYIIEGKIGISVLIQDAREYVFAFTLYQLILIGVFKIKDSIEIDALNALKNQYDKYQLYAEFKQPIPQSSIDELRAKLINNPKVILKNKYRTQLENLAHYCEMYNENKVDPNLFRLHLKQEARECDSLQKIYAFHWMNSLFLRGLK
ncbi:hypothetical protein P4H70_20720 [Paenibacillus ehimensis]|uniref:hypothetical protein n=1 Tax=Paenibacillus ehimensis TaxID=79264 RepID=UPI002DB67A48|nr:hypothetical protein [Paenibacillus ehimensis]MEC0211367.1 hypothetical protein [Paenibacillus ehimensis]